MTAHWALTAIAIGMGAGIGAGIGAFFVRKAN
jgi:hypothetical protein